MTGSVIYRFSILFLIINHSSVLDACDEIFEGFGVYLGSANHFSQSSPGTVKNVIDKVYSDLGIRHYRTSYESSFSTTPDVYNISCKDNFTCSWVEIHNEISKYHDISIMASIWSPPHYMKNAENLKVEHELAYLYFIRNITYLIKTQFNLTIERVSPVNEPENIFAPWEHTDMVPEQLCRMVKEFNDPLISICPENSYYWISEMYSKYSSPNMSGIDCHSSCEIFGTHAYDLNIDFETPDNFKAYYDLKVQERNTTKPIWMTEVSSTYGSSDTTQVQEALDFATNIVNYVGHTCIQRYYYWYSYTLWSSGESLIWGKADGQLTLPKKYHTYKHFTLASSGGPKKITKCNPTNVEEVSCIKFGEVNTVFVNKLNSTMEIGWDSSLKCVTGTLCCTSVASDWNCENNSVTMPARSVCSCKLDGDNKGTKPNSGNRLGIKYPLFIFMLFLTSKIQF